MKQARQKQQGLTLVEILVAVAVSLLLLGGLIQLFISNKATYNLQEGMSRVQENGRFAMYFLTDSARMAGYMGCVSRVSNVTNTLNSASNAAYNFGVGIQGYEFTGTDPDSTEKKAYAITASSPTPSNTAASWSPALPTELANKVIPGTDVLTVRSVDDSGIRVSKNNNSAQLFVTNTGTQGRTCSDDNDAVSGLCLGDILVVADCTKARIFQATNLTTTKGGTDINVVHSNANYTPGNAISSWGGSSAPQEEQFGTDSTIFRTSTKFFFVGVGANGSPALFRQEGTGAPQELIENVESLQILYGEDTSGDLAADRYVAASSSVDWGAVVSVRLSVLLRSDDNLSPETNDAVYDLAGTRLDPVDDRRHRRVFTSTVVLRNRTL